jgi:hypothetical protein
LNRGVLDARNWQSPESVPHRSMCRQRLLADKLGLRSRNGEVA